MFSTPLICCSIGVATVAATTSALAPGYWPVTLMIGGAISGYCATGRRENDTPPMITKKIETTAAKIGRSMKKCEMRITAYQSALTSPAGLAVRRAPRRRRVAPASSAATFMPGARPHQAVDDDAVGRGAGRP